MDNPKQEFGLALVALSRAWRNKLDERLRVFGLSQAKWVTLLYVFHHPEGLIQKELAKLIGIEGPTLVRLLDRLEIDGLITRTPSLADRRIRKIHLTVKAAPLLLQIEQIAENLRLEVLADVSSAELKICSDTMSRVKKRVDLLN
ncbi:MAG: MarR family transcriptional regulator [Proteobacteria bacterium]|nr:MarR family transcriptional regulator [Pseudomonadota bacterium]